MALYPKYDKKIRLDGSVAEGTDMLARQKWQARTIQVLEMLFEERLRQVQKHGWAMRELPDGTGPGVHWIPAGCRDRHMDGPDPVCGEHDYLWPDGQDVCNGALNSYEELGLEEGTASDIQRAFRQDYTQHRGAENPHGQYGELTRMHLVREELAEAFELDGDDPNFIGEALQVAALLVQWVEYKLEAQGRGSSSVS